MGKETTVRHNGKQHSHDNKMLEKEVKKMVGAAGDEAANNLTLNPRGVHKSIVAKMMEKHRNQSAKRKAENNFPPEPKDWEFEVPPEFKVTPCLDGFTFC